MLKWKIGLVLVLLIVFLPIIANAEEARKVYSVEELEAYVRDGWRVSYGGSYTTPKIISDRAKVDENVLIEGALHVDMHKIIKGETMSLSGLASNNPISVSVYKNDLLIEEHSQVNTDDSGHYKYTSFIPRESGYYEIEMFSYDPIGYEWHNMTAFSFYVSEKDTDTDGEGVQDRDGDGVPDKYDYAPSDPTVQSKGDIKTPGFEVLFAIVGLLSAMCMLRRKVRVK